jgi:hypothetical protein
MRKSLPKIGLSTDGVCIKKMQILVKTEKKLKTTQRVDLEAADFKV